MIDPHKKRRIDELVAEWHHLNQNPKALEAAFNDIVAVADSGGMGLDKRDRMLLELDDLNALTVAFELVTKHAIMESEVFSLVMVLLHTDRFDAARSVAKTIPPSDTENVLRAHAEIMRATGIRADVATVRQLMRDCPKAEHTVLDAILGIWSVLHDPRDLEAARRYALGFVHANNRRARCFLTIAETTGAFWDYIQVATNLSEDPCHAVMRSKESMATLTAHALTRHTGMSTKLRNRIVTGFRAVDRPFGDNVYFLLRSERFI